MRLGAPLMSEFGDPDSWVAALRREGYTAAFCPVGADDDCGLYLELGEGNLRCRAAVLPGIVREIGVREFRRLEFGEEVVLEEKPCLLALDGERELAVGREDEARVRVERDGPRVVDINKALRRAAAQGFFTVQGQEDRG